MSTIVGNPITISGVASFNGRNGAVTPKSGDYTKAMVGLGNVDNTSDEAKPISTATQAALDAKYTKPSSGIPKTDLASAVQTSLDKADSAVLYTSQSLTAAQKSQARTNIAAAPSAHNHNSLYLPLTGGTLTGNLTGKYITGTWLQTTSVADKAGDFATIDSEGWIYKRTAEEAKNDIIQGNIIDPASIEFKPSASAGHGGHIDFHFNNADVDYTSRLIELANGVIYYNDHRLLSSENVVGINGASCTFTNGQCHYSNSNVKTASAILAQWRYGAVTTVQNMPLAAYPIENGTILLTTSNTNSFTLPVNIIIVNNP